MFRRKGSDSDDFNRTQNTHGDDSRPNAPRASSMRIGASGPPPFHPDVPNRASSPMIPGGSGPVDADSKRLTVGKDISVNGGEISDCDRLVVEGTITGSMTGGRVLEIAREGLFQGDATVENADIAGTFEGTLTVLNRLSAHASGRIVGSITYGQLEVERGGKIEGESHHDGTNQEADLAPVGGLSGSTGIASRTS